MTKIINFNKLIKKMSANITKLFKKKINEIPFELAKA